MAILVAILNLLALLAWGCLMLFLYAVGGGRSWDPTTLFLYCGPLAYFCLCFVKRSLVSCVPEKICART
ncbi:MAG: hypothetical protein HYX47_03060 [Burkholderiales bacterium]|nr:hypothetical protein [Burkholderiales bacterium]